MKILIVDDEEINVMLIKEMLNEYLKEIDRVDSIVESANDGIKAVEKVKNSGEYDLIFMDVMMPEMDGFEATKQIRMLNLKRQPIVIMITALDDKDAMREGFFSGVNWYLTKPVDMEELEVLVNDVVAGKILSNNSKKILDFKKRQPKEKKIEEFAQTDEFFDFDSESVDKKIDDMHDIQEVSAVEFMKEGLIDNHELIDLQEAIEEYHHNLEGSRDEFMENIDRLLQTFVKLLNHTYVFRNLAYGLQNLSMDIKNSNLKDLDDDKFEMYKIMLEAIVFDLEKWVDEVLVNKTATNIHYLDASILANSAQIDMLLKHN